MLPASSVDEVIMSDVETGGQKGSKPDRYDMIDIWPLRMLARVYWWGSGRSDSKYPFRNWEKGFSWSLCYSAAMRHLNAFWAGEFWDPETKLPHLAHAAWQCFVLMKFWKYKLGTDDRSRIDTWEV